MPKMFIFGDVHGCYNELIKGLAEAGYDSKNPDHWLIGLGDYFDRGDQPLEVMHYLMKAPHKVLVRGNHEDLFDDMCDRGCPGQHDIENGTLDTARILIGQPNAEYVSFFDAAEKVYPFFRKMVNYFETEKYIFVHSFVPLFKEPKNVPSIWTKDITYSFNPDWRFAHYSEWKEARWGNPFELAKQFASKLGKTIVFGHWYTFTQRPTSSWNSVLLKDCVPYYGDNYIGIDGCTPFTHKQNILVLEDDFIEEEN